MPSEEDGSRFFETYSHKTGKSSKRIVDDLNIRKPTLGLRRLTLAKLGKKLFNFKVAVYTLGDLLRLTRPNNCWIDSKGKLFTLSKRTMFNLEFKKIKTVYQKVGYSVLVLEDTVERFRSLYGPPGKEYGVLLLVSGNIKLFYAYALEQGTKKRVKV